MHVKFHVFHHTRTDKHAERCFWSRDFIVIYG